MDPELSAFESEEAEIEQDRQKKEQQLQKLKPAAKKAPKKIAEKAESKVNRLQPEKKVFPVQKSIIYVGRLPYGFQEEQLTKFFSQYGKVEEIKLARSRKVPFLSFQ